MTIENARLSLLGACAALVLGGCGGSTAGTAIPSGAEVAAARHGWMSPLAKKKKEKLLYVTDYTSSVVLIYQQGDTGAGPIGEIVTGVSTPEGEAVDKSGTLYVANYGNNTVTEYPKGASSPSVTLSNGISKPRDVSVDSSGILYVADGSASEILEFKPGSTSPDATVSITHPSDLTNAKNGDLYVTYNESSTGRAATCKPLATTCTDLGISVGLAQGIAIDLQGNLLVGDYYGQVIDIYKPGQTAPFRQITTKLEEPAKLALDTKDKTLYQADPANFSVDIYNYKAGTQESTFTFGSGNELEGVALAPGQKPGK